MAMPKSGLQFRLYPLLKFQMTELYQAECERLCIPPLPQLISILAKKPEVIDLQKMYIGDKQAIALSAAFKNYHPKQIIAPFNGLMNFGVTSILQAVEKTEISLLDLSRNDFSPSCVKEICRVINTTPSLQEVKIVQCCHLKPEHVKRLQDAFSKRRE